MSVAVCLTTFRQGDSENLIDTVRSEVFMDSVIALNKNSIPCVALTTETSNQFIQKIEGLDVVVLSQESVGMGNIRREVLSKTISLYPEIDFYLWMEPEKLNLVKFINAMANLMNVEKSDLGIFNRNSMNSYPEEQAYYYLFCRKVASRLLGFDFDYAFGPIMMSKLGAKYFLDYNGEYGDRWESIMIPRLRAINDGLKFSVLNINFENDPRMTDVESGDSDMILKRIDQLNNVIPSLLKEFERLKNL